MFNVFYSFFINVFVTILINIYQCLVDQMIKYCLKFYTNIQGKYKVFLCHPVEVIEVTLWFGRRLLSINLTTYLPTLLICIVSFCTNHFQSEYFEASVAVNLTSMLVLTTLFISISDGLPKTAYIKFIDIWLIVCLLIPFAEVILQTMICNAVQETNKTSKVMPDSKELTWTSNIGIEDKENLTLDNKKKKILVALAEKGLPIIFCAFIAIYFIAGMSQRH